jgi:hypothetical protein
LRSERLLDSSLRARLLYIQDAIQIILVQTIIWVAAEHILLRRRSTLEVVSPYPLVFKIQILELREDDLVKGVTHGIASGLWWLVHHH